jgi:hypothetical protein
LNPATGLSHDQNAAISGGERGQKMEIWTEKNLYHNAISLKKCASKSACNLLNTLTYNADTHLCHIKSSEAPSLPAWVFYYEVPSFAYNFVQPIPYSLRSSCG